MKLLDFFEAEQRICYVYEGGGLCSKNKCRGNLGIFELQHPWYCQWRVTYLEEYNFALTEGLVAVVSSEYAAHNEYCLKMSKKGLIIHRQLKGDYR